MLRLSSAVILSLLIPAQISAQTAQNVAESGQASPSYAALTNLMVDAPAVIDATIRDTTFLKGPDAANVPAGQAKFYILSDIGALIRGPNGLAPRVAYLVQVPLDARGKPPKLKKRRVILFARPVANRPGEIQLAAPGAQFDWTPALDSRVRGIARELVAPDAPPKITGIGNVFHVPGTLPGEGETQIFLTTADSRPVSLSILRRPGQEPKWAVALAEIVDEAAEPPARDTLLWYRLACGLPRALPDAATGAMEPNDARTALEDYALVIRALGSCS